MTFIARIKDAVLAKHADLAVRTAQDKFKRMARDLAKREADLERRSIEVASRYSAVESSLSEMDPVARYEARRPIIRQMEEIEQEGLALAIERQHFEQGMQAFEQQIRALTRPRLAAVGGRRV